MAKLQPTDAPLYEHDFYAWTQDQAAKLRARAHNSIDWDNAAEEIESLGRSEQREIESRLNVLLIHLLKWIYQPSHRSSGWKGTIIEQRHRLLRCIKQNPSLRKLPGEILEEEFESARRLASSETGLAEWAFPATCPFTIEDILDPDFYPDSA